MYEPYIVGVKDRLPAYNTSLVGRGLNKLAHILNIYILGCVYYRPQTKFGAR